jgi:hypothetical protein
VTAGIKANVDGSAAIQVGGVDAITLTSAGAASFVTSPMTIQGGSAAAPSLTFSGDTNTGIFSPAADTIAFSEGGVESMRIDASGNVGLSGTPSAWASGTQYRAIQFQDGWSVLANDNGNGTTILGSNFYASANNTFRYINSNFATMYQQNLPSGQHRWYVAPSGTAGNAITFTQAMTLSAAGGLSVGTTADAGAGNIRITGGMLIADGTASAPTYTFTNQSDVGMFRAGAGVLGFSTGGTERARITSGGNFVVGDTTATNALLGARNASNVPLLAAFSTASSGYTDALVLSEFRNYAPNDVTARFLYCGDNAAARCVIRSNGGIANFSGNNVNLSDRREKINFAPAGEYLSKICAIPVQTFNYIDQNMEDDPGLTLGVVAQDVQEVAPELVMESNWAGKDEEPKMRLSIYQTDLQYALMKCIQELKAELDATKAEVALLKGAA